MDLAIHRGNQVLTRTSATIAVHTLLRICLANLPE
jgi:hypothetical protein